MVANLANQLRPEIYYPTSAAESLRETAQYSILQDNAFRRSLNQQYEIIQETLQAIQIATTQPHTGATASSTPPTASTNAEIPVWLSAGLAEIAIEIAAHIVKAADIEWDTPFQREVVIFAFGWGIGYCLAQSTVGVRLFEYPGFSYSLLRLAAAAREASDD